MRSTESPTSGLSSTLRGCLGSDVPRASAFIVTIYGDVVEPRGGMLWMGTLIDCCADHGISESLVRTAVSRLVGAGRLVGERVGRKSYYRLTETAQTEFIGAAQILYAPPPEPVGWLVAFCDNLNRNPQWSSDWVRVAPETALAPNRNDVRYPDGLVMSAETIAGEGRLRAFAARYWPLSDVAEDYGGFVRKYTAVASELAQDCRLPGAIALALRLRLVHDYRHAALSDPRLPRAAWPVGWPGEEARRLFVDIYLILAEAADTHIGRTFHGADGLLPERTAGTALRLDRLRRETVR